jgi:hypothetical protein
MDGAVAAFSETVQFIIAPVEPKNAMPAPNIPALPVELILFPLMVEF